MAFGLKSKNGKENQLQQRILYKKSHFYVMSWTVDVFDIIKDCMFPHLMMTGIGMPDFDLDAEAEKLYREANVYGLLSHFMWGLWSFKQDTISRITFAYNE